MKISQKTVCILMRMLVGVGIGTACLAQAQPSIQGALETNGASSLRMEWAQEFERNGIEQLHLVGQTCFVDLAMAIVRQLTHTTRDISIVRESLKSSETNGYMILPEVILETQDKCRFKFRTSEAGNTTEVTMRILVDLSKCKLFPAEPRDFIISQAYDKSFSEAGGPAHSFPVIQYRTATKYRLTPLGHITSDRFWNVASHVQIKRHAQSFRLVTGVTDQTFLFDVSTEPFTQCLSSGISQIAK